MRRPAHFDRSAVLAQAEKRLDPHAAFRDQGAAAAPSDRRGRDFERAPENGRRLAEILMRH
jgi:hypothetical protein